MRKTLMLILAVFISAVWVQAQDAGQTTGKTSDPNMIQGCLQSSMGLYTLTDKDGLVHQLSARPTSLATRWVARLKSPASRG